MSTSPDGIYEAGIIDPGFPVENATKPFWLTEPSQFNQLQSTWLDTVDVTIIGSGMTAVSIARTLYSHRPHMRIVIVEARDLCSGATGRNGGHIKAMSPGSWFERKHAYGVDEAVRIMEFEHSHLDGMTACIKENNINCDLRLVEGLDVYHDEKIFGRAVAALEDMRSHSPDLAARYTVYTSRETLKARNLDEHCVGAIGMNAGTMWPYKMVARLLEEMVQENNLSVQTNTMVTSIVDNEEDSFATVKTSRGDIRSTHVIHATNGWIGHLVPELRPFVSPVRANVQRQVRQLSQLRVDNYSFWLRYAEHDYDYMIQRPDGAFVIGRANTGRRATADYSKTDLAPQSHLRGAVQHIFDFGSDQVDITHAWSGPVAFTQDGNPFIGRLPFPNRHHQWVCAAYQGIGMVRVFKSAHVLALMLLEQEIPSDFPRSMLMTSDRLKALQMSVENKA